MIFDYETLKLIWWAFVGVLLVGFALTGGFDLGVGTLLPILGRDDMERRILINAIGPTWEGNQTWLITAGGALFAAWPLVYAAAFSGFYIAFMLLLFALFFRPVGFDYRSKIADPRWRNTWDWALFAGGFIPALLLGVAFGNLLLGVPFRYDDTMRLEYTGGFFDLLNPMGLLAGVVSVAMFCMHGAAYIQMKTSGVIAGRAARAAVISAVIACLAFALAGLLVWNSVEGYRIVSMPDVNSAFMPVAKTVVKEAGAWTLNYEKWPMLLLFPAAAFAGAVFCSLFSLKKWAWPAFIASGVSVGSIVLTAGTAMFPFVMPSSLEPGSGLTLWDAVASHRSLGMMFWVVLIMLPIVSLYTAWVYRVLRGKVTAEQIAKDEHSFY